MRIGVGVLEILLMTLLADAKQEPLALVRAIELPRVEGRIDHLAFDAATRRPYVAALGNNSVEVLDAGAGTHLKSLPGFREPQGILTRGPASLTAPEYSKHIRRLQQLMKQWQARVGDTLALPTENNRAGLSKNTLPERAISHCYFGTQYTDPART